MKISRIIHVFSNAMPYNRQGGCVFATKQTVIGFNITRPGVDKMILKVNCSGEVTFSQKKACWS